MSFGPSYEVSVPGGVDIRLRPPEYGALNKLFPVPEPVMAYLGGSGTAGNLGQPTAALFFDTLKNPNILAWGIDIDRGLVGVAGLIKYCNQEFVDGFTFILNPNFWRQGIGTSARLAVTNYAFEVERHPVVRGGAHSQNVASNEMLQSIGFQLYSKSSSYSGYLLPAPVHVCDQIPRFLTKSKADRGRQIYAERMEERSIRELPPQ